MPKACVHCGSEYVYFLGTGSEKLEELLHGMFPQARIARLDRDTVRSHEDFERALNALNEGELDLLVGTQMIAKGHDIHGVTLVGVVGADVALGLPDFRAAERTFQLLTQVAGRAGRGADSRQSRSANLFSGSLRRAVRRTPRLHRLLREGIAIPQLDALSAIFGAGERAGAKRQTR